MFLIVVTGFDPGFESERANNSLGRFVAIFAAGVAFPALKHKVGHRLI